MMKVEEDEIKNIIFKGRVKKYVYIIKGKTKKFIHPGNEQENQNAANFIQNLYFFRIYSGSFFLVYSSLFL